MIYTKRRAMPKIPTGSENWVINRELKAHFRSLGTFIVGHLISIIMIMTVFRYKIPVSISLAWCSCVILMCWHRYYIGLTMQRNKMNRTPEFYKTTLQVNTILIATLIAAAAIYIIPIATEDQNIFLVFAIIAMTSSSEVSLRSLPGCSMSYLIIVTLGTSIGLFGDAQWDATAAIIMLTVSMFLLCRSSLTAHGYFVVRILREREMRASAETIKMLLNDYEDQGSDWLFELDSKGNLCTVSPRLTRALDLSSSEVTGMRFIDLFDDTPERAQLADHLMHNRAFRGLTLALHQEDQKLWWSVSARPSTKSDFDGTRFRGVISDVSSERQAQARVRHLAQYDSLTGLPNRFRFNSKLDLAAQNLVDNQRFAVLVLDIDKFKIINDTLGHPIGDQFLQMFSSRVADLVETSALGGESGIIARLGGDEFAILMTGDSVVDHATRLCDALVTAAAEPFIVDGHHITSGLSIGLVIAPDNGTSSDTLMRNADLALYCAKEAGRGRWEHFHASMDEAAQKRHTLERDLRKALANNEFQLYFQPLVTANDGVHVGFEALLRWHQPDRGMVMPNDFIPLAEETGLIVPIGEWIIREAMNEAASWSQPLSVAVNISPIQMRSPNLVPTLMNALATSGLDPSRFEIEITEGVLLHNTEENMAMLHKFHELGVKIALDDFGTGYSSLNYLRTFPFDKIKIDRSFVSDLENQKDCREIVSAVIGLANNLGMVTLAEGVEDQGQLEELQRGGCTMVQGWLFGKAMPAEHYNNLRRLADTTEQSEPTSAVKPGQQRKAA